MTTTEMIKSLVGRKFQYLNNSYELIQAEPTVILQSVNDDTHVELPQETFKRRLLDCDIAEIKGR